jgi:mannitol/fructose-specific phosphotransferase system IIA component
LKADQVSAAAVLSSDAIRLRQQAVDKDDAVRQCGAVLVEIGAVAPPYAAAMLEREASVSTYVGEGVAIPHGTDESRSHVLRTALAVLQFPDGVEWVGGRVHVCVAIASSGSEHVALLAALADVLMQPDKVAQLRTAETAEQVLSLLQPSPEENST